MMTNDRKRSEANFQFSKGAEERIELLQAENMQLINSLAAAKSDNATLTV